MIRVITEDLLVMDIYNSLIYCLFARTPVHSTCQTLSVSAAISKCIRMAAVFKVRWGTAI